MNRKRKLLRNLPLGAAAVGVLVLGIGAGAAVGAAPVIFAPAGVQAEGAVPAPAPSHAVNENGQTYGTLSESTSPANEPDLILVEMDNGERGYALKVDLDRASGIAAAESFETPQEAVAWQTQRSAIASVSVVPVYDETGTKVIGEFVVGSETK